MQHVRSPHVKFVDHHAIPVSNADVNLDVASPAPSANYGLPPLSEVTRAAAITRVLEEHGGCDLSELVTLLRAGGRTEEKPESVSVMLTTMKNHGIVEGFSGEWRLVQPPSAVERPATSASPSVTAP